MLLHVMRLVMHLVVLMPHHGVLVHFHRTIVEGVRVPILGGVVLRMSQGCKSHDEGGQGKYFFHVGSFQKGRESMRGSAHPTFNATQRHWLTLAPPTVR
jgi:hypothetical protein